MLVRGSTLIIVAWLVVCSCSLQTLLRDKQTCIAFMAQAKDQQRQIYYNYEVGPEKIHLDVWHTATSKLVNSSRSITERNHYLMVRSEQAGEHMVCFQKQSAYEQQLQFDIIDEKYMADHVAGKEEVLKLLSSGRKMIQHLDKVNINQKSMLMEYHRRTDELKQSAKQANFGVLIKLLVVGVVLVGQFLAVRQLFQ